ncbi:hypothetical protein CPB86DRAFT_778206 [Serendipita vermifera]|nr:hypothetical protein CPB86DRAFT_778206 [Serendipita vermifera]
MFGAVGGAIFAFPFAALFTLFIRYMNTRPSRPVDEEDPRRPLLSLPPPYAETTHTVQGTRPSQSSAVRETPSRGIIFTYGDQRTRSAAHNLILRDGLAQAGIWLLSPLIGAISGVIGSLVVGRVDGYFYTIQDVAVAGAVGGLFCLLFHALTLFGCQG